MRLGSEIVRWIWKTVCSSGKFLTTPLLLFALADVIHVYRNNNISFICMTMNDTDLLHHGKRNFGPN